MAAGWIGSIGALLSGQQQGREQTDDYRTELRQRQLQQELETQKLLQQLKEQNADESALSSLPKEAQPYVRLGLGGEYMKEKARQQASPYEGLGFEALAGQEKDPLKQAFYRIAARMRANGVPEPEIKDFLDRGGLKPPSAGAGSDFAQFQAAHPELGFDAAYSQFKALGREPKESGGAKWLDKVVSDTGANIVTPSGEPWANPAATRREALAAGGVVLSDKGKDALAQIDAAESGIDTMLETGKAVLPGYTGKLGNVLNPLTLTGKRAFGETDIADFDATKIALINHLRAVAGIARVNAQELNQVNSALSSANSYPALEVAVKRARAALQRTRPNLVKAGRLTLPNFGPTPPGASSMSAPTSAGSPGGGPPPGALPPLRFKDGAWGPE